MRFFSKLKSVRPFLLVWSGQTVSLLGSRMTTFATMLWAWQITGQATTLSFLWFFIQVPQVLMSPFAGVIVDRWDRKTLMMVGDAISALSTVALLLLHLTGHLHIWHFYLTGAINAAFAQIQELAYSASVALMLPKSQYSRASSLEFLASYGSRILAPAAASLLYPVVGLVGIFAIDLATFVVAVSTVLTATIPQPIPSKAAQSEAGSALEIWHDMQFGFRYIFAIPPLRSFVLMAALFQFVHDLGDAVYAPMILARSGNDVALFGAVGVAAGMGGVTGSIIMTAWGGPKKRIHGVLLGIMGAGVSKTLLALGQSALVWLPTQFFASLNFPLMGSSEQTIWLFKVQPNIQGRVFAARWMMVQLASPVSFLIGGPLADWVLEPAMQPGGQLAPLLGHFFGTGSGAGMSVLYALTSIALVGIGLGGYAVSAIRQVETAVPDPM
ncbi:MAG: MFS transporter [Leptolyngbya foveolarum]|uniref:MFS transporter n=1 Tax=Leptolyngbya foveolarum TaxID=47253 RepID=A0A2W4W868_9CYAN|nr:MAG: MFS transporter [Leptolyngbya foveolarum]